MKNALALAEKFQITLTVRDALKAVVILGRSNGVSDSFYRNLLENLNLESNRDLGLNLNNKTTNTIGLINYLSIQDDIENAYLTKNPVIIALKSKIAEMQNLQSEIDNLKEELKNNG